MVNPFHDQAIHVNTWEYDKLYASFDMRYIYEWVEMNKKIITNQRLSK
jgi:hypothetical protein